jgi:hypothetical protein
VKMPLFIAGAFLMFSATSQAAPHGGGGFRSGFAAHGGGAASRMGAGFGRHAAFRAGFGFDHNRRFFQRGHRFFVQQSVWPAYWFPYDYFPYDYSYLDYGPNDNYQYWDNSAAPVQPESSRTAGGTVVVINTGSNAGTVDPRPNTAYVNGGYAIGTPGQRNLVPQDPPQTDPGPFVPPAQPAQTATKHVPTTAPTQTGPFSNLVLVSWLQEAGKDVIYVQNTETNDVQKITSEPNLDNFRIVELHPNADPQLVQAVISNGSQQGPVRFRF